MYGAYLRAARERAGFSVAAAASAIGVGADAIYRYERDANSPSMEALDRLAAVYGCLAGDLLPNSGGGPTGDLFEPLMAALAGLDADEMRDQVLLMASQARLYRNAVMRRSAVRDLGHPTHSKPQPYTGASDTFDEFGVVPEEDDHHARSNAVASPKAKAARRINR